MASVQVQLASLKFDKDDRPYTPANRDLGPHNVFVEDGCGVLGLNDFVAIITAPIDVVAQFSLYLRLEDSIPRRVETGVFVRLADLLR